MSQWSIQSCDPERPQERACLRVLLVVDSMYWTIGHFAHQVTKKNPRLEAVICSQYVIRQYTKRYRSFPLSFDLVHFLNTKTMKPFCGRLPVVTTLHHIDASTNVKYLEDCDAVMTVSGQWYQYLIDLGISSQRLGVVPFAVDCETFHPGSRDERRHLRHELKFAEDAFVIGFSGRRTSDNDGRKGTDCLLESLKNMRQAYPHLATLIIGPGWEDLEGRLQAEGIMAVHIPYQLDHYEIARMYRALDVYWVTSRIEGGPVPLLEAMASGIPCVSTPVGAVLDIVKDQRNGFVVPFDSPDEFVRTTLTLAANREFSLRIGQEARATMMQERSWSQTQVRLARLYEIAIENFRVNQSRTVLNEKDPGVEFQQVRHASWHTSGCFDDFTPKIKQWMKACEHVRGSKMLIQLGEWRRARELVGLALKEQPYDLNVWTQIFSMLLGIVKKKIWPRRTNHDNSSRIQSPGGS
ncbi:glycosyltransferase family 4 protein [Candidatus Nitrospira salsa]